MGLFPKDEPGQAMFFSPAKIAAVRVYQDELEAQNKQERLDKEQERQVKIVGKERKTQEARERHEIRRMEAVEKRILKEKEKEVRRLQKEANQQLQIEQQALKHQLKISTVKPKRVKVGISRSGRFIVPPERFLD